jgi:hypothetical protein
MLNFTAADWSGDDKRLAVTEKRLAMAIISRLTARRPTPVKAIVCGGSPKAWRDWPLPET